MQLALREDKMIIQRKLLFISLMFAACGPIDELDDAEPEGGELAESVDALVTPLLDSQELELLRLINDYRADHGRVRLRVSIALTRAADFHSADLAEHNAFQHDSTDGTDTFDRVRRFYDYNTHLGENLALGYSDAAGAFEGWRNSPGHDANMLGENYRVIGISRLEDDRGTYWTNDFGGFKDAILSAGVSSIAANGSFESSAVTTGVSWSAVRTLERWHFHGTGGGTVARRSGTAYDGSFSVRAVDVAGGRTSATQLVRAMPNVNYRVSARAKRVSGSSTQAIYLDFLDAEYRRIAVYTAATSTSNAWTQVSREFTSPARTAFVRVLLYGSAAAGVASTYDWDDVRVTAW